ncbi:DUF5365 family protein [Bacillus sp. FJAT-49711]|uniref:DUF5365 family protein n=1 Tax=Bacillus sp. FJAT-49711 TaxID=2833585 RepID=UPI001BC91AF8|nr:DUF5365 family protein [Bacillus sp. FJAT-49711]MBS4218160.1 DUF5365 family protein [Bacillus sp. FJAT-49711]
MKVVVAATEEQEEKLDELINYFYTSIFPQYFNDCEIADFLNLNILRLPVQKEHSLFTLDGAFRAICSIQVLILNLEGQFDSEHTLLFEKNVEILNESGLFFPFSFENFISRNNGNTDILFSMYSNPTNQLLM